MLIVHGIGAHGGAVLSTTEAPPPGDMETGRRSTLHCQVLINPGKWDLSTIGHFFDKTHERHGRA